MGAKDMRAERYRFVAFAFSAADLMLEVSGEGLITFASGAARLIAGGEAEALLGRKFSDMVDDSDRHFVLTLLAGLAVGGRIEPVTIRLLHLDGTPGAVCVLGGCCLPRQDGRYYLTLSNARLPQAVEITDGALKGPGAEGGRGRRIRGRKQRRERAGRRQSQIAP